MNSTLVREMGWYLSVLLRMTLVLFLSLATPASADLLEEIIVTAEKREENLQDVSVSVTAFSSETLKDIGLTNTNDIGQYIPGVEVAAPSGNQQFKAFIRGSGAVDFSANTQTTIGVYVDEVYMHNSFMHTMQTFDLERIEVLRGPQGTLYGRNATGGAFNYITAKPTDSSSGYVEAGFGNFGSILFETALSGPISENLSGRIAMTHNEDDGWMKGRTSAGGVIDGDLNATKFYSWRSMLEWSPSDDFSALLTMNGSQDKSDAFSYGHAGAVDPITFGGCDATLSDDCIDFFYYQDPDGQEERGDPTIGDFDMHEQVDYETVGASIRLDWQFDNFSIVSISAYNDFQRYHPGEEDGSPYEQSHNWYFHETDGWSQEVRAASNTDSDFEWLVGVYFGEDDLNAINKYSYFQFITDQVFDQEQESKAVYANLGYRVSDRVKLTFGVRYTEDKVSLSHKSDAYDPPYPIGYGYGNFPLDTGTSGANTYDDLGWKLGLDYTPEEDLLFYVSVGTGYKSGGINVGFGDPAEFNIYDEETMLAYEAGAKTRFFDGKAQLNFSAYYYDYEDLQIFDQFIGPYGSLFAIGNAPSADYHGFELEFVGKPLSELEIMLAVSRLSAEFNELDRPITGEDLTGNSNVYSPPWKFLGLIKYVTPTPSLGSGSLSASLNWSWTDELFHSIDNTNAARKKQHWLLGGRIAWLSADEKTELALWGSNLTDEYFRVQSFDFSVAGWWTLVPNRPRSFGVEASYRW